MAAEVGGKRRAADDADEIESDEDTGAGGGGGKRRRVAVTGGKGTTDWVDQLSWTQRNAPALVLREEVSKERLDTLISGKVAGVSEEEVADLERYKRTTKATSTTYYKDVRYHFGENAVESDIGRWYANGPSLQGMSRRLRNVLAVTIYVDVDIKNAQATFLQQLYEKKDWPCDALRGFNADRDSILAGIMAAEGCTRDDAKKTINAVMFGSRAEPPEPLRALAEELRVTHALVLADNPQLAGVIAKVKGKENLAGKVTANVCQTIERGVTEALHNAADVARHPMGCFIHDGGLLKLLKGTAVSDDMLRGFEEKIVKATGFRVELVRKPMETDIVLPKTAATDYAEQKAEFELYHCKVGGEYCIFGDGDGKGKSKGFTFTSEPNMITRYRHRTLTDGSKFILKWRDDPAMRVYSDRVFWPPGAPDIDPSRDVLNTWPGTAAERLAPLTEADAADADLAAKFRRVQYHIEMVICNSVAQMLVWLQGYIACMLVTPGDKQRSPMIVLAGIKGAGKDTFVELLKNVVGTGLTYTSKNFDHILGKFTSESAGKLLIWVQEGPLKNDATLVEAAKNRIMADTQEFVGKCLNPVQLTDCARIINTTNHMDAAPVGEYDRHFCPIKVSDKHRGDKAYFDQLNADVRCPLLLRKFFEYYTTTPTLLEGWRGDSYPRSELHRDLEQSSADPIADFAAHWVSGREEDGNVEVALQQLYADYKLWSADTRPGAAVLTQKQFEGKIKHDGKMDSAFVSKRRVDHNSKTLVTVSLNAWRDELRRCRVLPDDESAVARLGAACCMLRVTQVTLWAARAQRAQLRPQ